MTSNAINECNSPHDFLTSIVFSLSYASTGRGPMLQSSLLELGYTFTALEVPGIYNMPAPDFLLVNNHRKIVIAVECKGDIISKDKLVSKLKRKFSREIVDVIRSVARDKNNEYTIEFVIHTFDTYGNYYVNIAQAINKDVDSSVIIWTTTEKPQIKAGESFGDYSKHYTLRKYDSSEYDINHVDGTLNDILSQGIIISERDIVCNPLVNPDVGYPTLFYYISEYILLAALSDKYRGKRLLMNEFISLIKHDYQSPIKRERIYGVIRDILSVFPWLAKIRGGGAEIEFKKIPRIDIDSFYNVKEKIISLGDEEARRFIRNSKTIIGNKKQ